MTEIAVTPISYHPDYCGISMRVAFYAQSWFIPILVARSSKAEDFKYHIMWLICFNVVASTILIVSGVESTRSKLVYPATLYDAVVLLYLLKPSIIATHLCVHMADARPEKKPSVLLKRAVHFQTYWTFAAALFVLVVAPGYAQCTECNVLLKLVVVFRPFDFMDAGRKVYLGIWATMAIAYTVIHIVHGPYRDVISVLSTRRQRPGDLESSVGASSLQRCGPLFGKACVLQAFLSWAAKNHINADGQTIMGISLAIAIFNTELLFMYNRPTSRGYDWTFSQIFVLLVMGTGGG